MATTLLQRFRGHALSSADESYDEFEYRSLGEDQPRPPQVSQPQSDNATQEPHEHTGTLNESESPAPRHRRKGRRLVFPLSAAGHVERANVDGKKFSIWSQLRCFFTRTPPTPTQADQKEDSTRGADNSAFTSDDKRSAEPQQQTSQSRHDDVPNVTSHLPGERAPRPTDLRLGEAPGLTVTEPTPGSAACAEGARPFSDDSEAASGLLGLKRKHRMSARQRTERARERGYAGILDDGHSRSSNLPFSTLYPKAYAAWQRKRERFLTNKIKTTKYTLLSFFPKNLFEQFHRIANFYFLFIIILNFMPMINSFDKYIAMLPLLVVLTFQAAKDIAEDLARYRSDTRVNNLKTLAYNKRKRKGEGRNRYILPHHLSHDEELDEKYRKILDMQKHYLDNKIRTTKYTVLSFLPKNLFEQFHRFANCYFVFIILLNFIPAIEAVEPFLSMAPVITILMIQGIKDIAEDYGRYKSDGQVNNSKTEVYQRGDDKYHHIKWKSVQVGDIVRLFCNRVIPADILLLHSSDESGVCYIETSNIDGETNLKQRTVSKGVAKNFRAKDFKSIIQCEKPNNQIDKFTGNIISPTSKESVNKENLLLRGCVIRNTDYVEGIVLYAGHETKAMLNNNGPRYKRSKLERRMNLDVIWCVVLLIIMCTIGAVGNSIWASSKSWIYQTILYLPPTEDDDILSPALSGFYMFWTMVILLQVLIPISLYVSIEIVKLGQVFFISNDLDLYHAESDRSVECRALNITEDLGQVQYVFSDKTGTLTENSMVFRRCTVGGVDYPHAANAARIESQEPAPPELNPTTEQNEKFRQAVREHKRAERARSAQPFTRGGEQRASYRRPASSSMRAHHRRNPSSLSVQTLQRRMRHEPGWDADGTDLDGARRSAPNTPAHMRRGGAARDSSRRLPHKHHRRNISAVSAKEIMSNLATSGSDVDLEQQLHPEVEDLDVEDEFLEADVTPDPVLYKELETIGQNVVGLQLPSDKSRILDFFINLAICNTVVLSTDNASPRLKQEDMQDVSDAQEESKPLLQSFRNSFSVPNFFRKSTTPPAKFRSLLDDGAEGDSLHEATNNLYTISGDRVPPTSRSSSALDTLEAVQNLRFSTEYLRQLRYEAESPDEAALVYAAHAYGCSLAHRSTNTATVTLPKTDETLSFEVLHTFTFDSTRKRMSVVVRDPRTNQYVLYCKGADSTILQLLRDPKQVVSQDDDSGVGSEHSFSTHHESNSKKVLQDTNTFLNRYAREGLRTLCIAKRVLTDRQYQDWAEMHRRAEISMEDREQRIYDSYVSLEKDLELLGCTGIEDRLQDGVPETIESLRKAGMQVWVITGDKQETAVNIGYSCKLIEQNDEIIFLNATSHDELEEMIERHTEEQNDLRGPQPEIAPDPDASLLSFTVRFRSSSQPSNSNHSSNHPPLAIVIDGKTLGYALEKELRKKFIDLARRCHSVLVCRATPLQKGEVVKLVKEELHVMTLAIGDGANDVSMIQVADIGIGISGQEGMQAVMSSDFAMARFRFLQKLLLVHGHWNYARLAAMVLYFFYKNAAFVFLIFWYQFFCGLSGSNPIEQWYLLLYSLLFTSVPPLINGVLDKDVSAFNLMRKPHLYMQGVNSEMYTGRSFWINMIDGIYQSVALFFIPFFAYWDSDVGVITWGTPVTTACMFANLIHLGIETKTFTWIHWASHIGSVLLFFVFSFAYNAICPQCPAFWIMETLVQTSNYWFSILLGTTIALLPRYLIRTLQSNLWPTESQRERVREHTQGKYDTSPNTTASTSVNGTSGGSSSTYQNETYDERQGDNATDALTYDFPDSHDYMEVQRPQHNTNQNNSHAPSAESHAPSAPPSDGRGSINAAYVYDMAERRADASRRGSRDSFRAAVQGHPVVPTEREHIHQTAHHVAFADDAENANNNKLSGSMPNVSTPPRRGLVSGMTPVGDTASLASENSMSSATAGFSPPPEGARPTRIYVDPPGTPGDPQNAELSRALPNMPEKGQLPYSSTV